MKTIKYKLNEMTEMPFIFKLVPYIYTHTQRTLALKKCCALNGSERERDERDPILCEWRNGTEMSERE
jgi:hypothetical protein